ncbi:MAG TPA: TolC family protein, partial [bacterium]|nr:TolC family protein [bacterium]
MRREKDIMGKTFKSAIFATAMLCAVFLTTARADMSQIDRLIDSIDKVKPAEKAVLTLDQCLQVAIENNQDLAIKQAILNSVAGDLMIDRSRFFSHVDFIGNFGRSQGSPLSTYYPNLNPRAVTSLGGLDTSSYSASTSSGTSSTISDLAAQFGISDVSSLLSNIPSQYQSLLSGLLRTQGGDRTAQQLIAPGIDLSQIDPAQIQSLISQLQTLSTMFANAAAASTQRTSANNEVAIRYSRRLLEWGRDSSSSVSIRRNRRLAIYNYEQKLRDVISTVRTDFFLILLKKQQIETREKLLGEYEKKLWQQQERFDIAKDVPRIDVLTAELDVLNEKNRISSLKSDLIQKKLELLRLLDMPLATEVEFTGDLEPFNYSLDEVVAFTKQNSFQITYSKQEYDESEREFNQLAWDYKPIYNAKVGIEDHSGILGFTLNNSNQTYGVDMGAVKYTNMPGGSTASNRTHNNYTMSL